MNTGEGRKEEKEDRRSSEQAGQKVRKHREEGDAE